MRRRQRHHLMANLAKARAARLQYSELRRRGVQHSLEWLAWGRRRLGAAVYGRDVALPSPSPPGEPLPLTPELGAPAYWTRPEFQPVVALLSRVFDGSEVTRPAVEVGTGQGEFQDPGERRPRAGLSRTALPPSVVSGDSSPTERCCRATAGTACDS